ncbi:MAG: glycosyltransferase [Flavobacteriaceae bacterium]|nr:glycosyltransferase [Flavobacteriaceae bacterium]
MKLLIITHVSHKFKDESYWAYAPYVREMNLWFNYADEVHVLAPLTKNQPTKIDASYNHRALFLEEVPSFNVVNKMQTWNTLKKLPFILKRMFKAMKNADHIHLRCPGNMGLLGAFVQVFFPKKPKTAKYAGNWDSKSKQPWSYRLQKWILSNTFLTKNMQVLVYGDWPNQSKNIKPFFTATYSKQEVVNTTRHEQLRHPDLVSGSHDLKPDKQMLNQPFDRLRVTKQDECPSQTLKFLYVGTLTKNKRPQLCLEVIHQLTQQGYQVQLDFYGEGPERHVIENYILDYNLQKEVILKGNVSKEELKRAYQNNHFLLFFSQSEGWPKAVAESMFWGCVPITTAVSCVPYMLGYGTRGTLVKVENTEIVLAIESYLINPEKYKEHSQQAMDWSRQFTLEKLEEEIVKLLKS